MCGYNQKDREKVRETAAKGECKKDGWGGETNSWSEA